MRGAARLRALHGELAAAAAEAVTASAARAADYARAMAPVDSGELRDSISVHREGEWEAAVIASAPHAVMVEYGTGRMPPRPFLLPAAHAARDGFFGAARATFSRCIKEI